MFLCCGPYVHVVHYDLDSPQTREVAQAISEKNFEKAMSLRDPEFCESLEGFFATSVLESEPKLPHHLVSYSLDFRVQKHTDSVSQRMRVAIMQ